MMGFPTKAPPWAKYSCDRSTRLRFNYHDTAGFGTGNSHGLASLSQLNLLGKHTQKKTRLKFPAGVQGIHSG